MSYLQKCEYVRTREVKGFGVLQLYRIKWRSVIGIVSVGTPSEGGGYDAKTTRIVFYPRHSKLGQMLRRNAESERHFISEELRKVSDYAPFTFVFVSY